MMKTIRGLDEQIVHFQEDIPEDVQRQLPTYRKMFKAAVGMAATKEGEKAIDLYQVGLKLKLDQPDITLEDAEFRLLKEQCNHNPAGWMAHFHAQVMVRLNDAEEKKKADAN